MVDQLSLGEQCETVKEIEDRVAGLVDREDDNPLILGLAQPVREDAILLH